MAQVLLYNLSGDKGAKIRLAALRLGIRPRPVTEEEFAHPIGWLLGLEGFAPSEEPPEPFSEEMLVMADLDRRQFSAFLEALRRGRCPVARKAVLTGSNAAWSSAALCRELSAEHEALRRAGGKSVHSDEK